MSINKLVYLISAMLLCCGVCFADTGLLSIYESATAKYLLAGKIHAELTPVKNDYVDDTSRGTVEFNTEKGNKFSGADELKCRNYSRHTVIIPDGTTVKGVNFSQIEPYTNAIIGKNLTFISCNLKNVVIDKSWTLIDCLSIQARTREDKGQRIYEVEKDGRFMEVSREEIISDDSIITDIR
jgi:hypothetical protein